MTWEGYDLASISGGATYAILALLVCVVLCGMANYFTNEIISKAPKNLQGVLPQDVSNSTVLQGFQDISTFYLGLFNQKYILLVTLLLAVTGCIIFAIRE